MALVILGTSGQVGSALLRVCDQRGIRAIGLSRKEADFSKPGEIPQAIESQLHSSGQTQIHAVINAAAYTQVDLAEKEEALAHQINAETPEALAKWCLKRNIPLIHYSTDYVYSGTGVIPWKESDPVDPQNAYGRSKLAGEQKIASVGGKWLVFRTSWVYDATGKNFLRTMLRLGAEREVLKVVADQMGAPSFGLHLAQATLSALESAQKLPEFQTGIYHLCNSGVTHWCEFASRIFERAREMGLPLKIKEVQPITTSEYPTPAKRPLNSRLDSSKLKQVLNVTLPSWETGLNECMQEYMRSLK